MRRLGPGRDLPDWLVEWLVMAIAIALPCRHLVPTGSDFYVDWSNHQWAIGYTGEFFRRHLAMPGAFNTAEVAGLPVPVFYGSLFYPAMGFLARWSSPELAIRIAAIALYAMQFHLVSRALAATGAPRRIALGLACLAVWAIYPLTNLYNRGALTEFFATGLLTCALALLALLCLADTAAQRRRRASGFLLALTLAAGTHPITALLGVPMFAALGGVFWYLVRSDRARVRAILAALAPWLALAALCVAPWLYATASYGGQLAIRRTAPDVVFFPGAIDAWSTRFWPLPLDPRVVPGAAVSTPYLDAQVNLALLIALGVLAAMALAATRGSAARRPLVVALAATGALFAGSTALSLIPATYRALPAVALTIQFAYRAVTYQNLALLAGALAIAVAVPGLGARLRSPGVWAVPAACVALAAAGVVVKWQHIAAVQREHTPSDPLHLPVQYYGTADYATEAEFAPLGSEPTEARSFAVDDGPRFGLTRPLAIDEPAPTWVATNLQSFPWNAVRVDGARLGPADLRTAHGGLVARVPAGSHKLSARFEPPLVYRVLRSGALIGLAAWWFAIAVELAIAVGLSRRPRSAANLVK
jgi:hypothetical protein